MHKKGCKGIWRYQNFRCFSIIITSSCCQYACQVPRVYAIVYSFHDHFFLKIRICESRSRSTLTKQVCQLYIISDAPSSRVTSQESNIETERGRKGRRTVVAHPAETRLGSNRISYISKQRVADVGVHLTISNRSTIRHHRETDEERETASRARRAVNMNSVERREKRRENRLITDTTQQLVATRVSLLWHSCIFVPFRKRKTKNTKQLITLILPDRFRRQEKKGIEERILINDHTQKFQIYSS